MRILLPALILVLLTSGCRTREDLATGIGSASLPVMKTSVQKDTALPFEMVHAAFGGVAARPEIKRKNLVGFSILLFTVVRQKVECRAGANSFGDRLYSNMSAAITEEATRNFAEQNLDEYFLRVKIDSVEVKTAYVSGFNWMFGLREINVKRDFCKATSMTLKVSYELEKNDTVIKSATVLKQERISQRLYGSTLLPDSSNYADYQEYGKDKDYSNGPLLTSANAMQYALIEFNGLVAEAAKTIIAEVKQEVYSSR